MSVSEPVKVLYVIGKGRSGSTLVDMLLGELDGWCSTGELWRVWERGILGGEPCGCGALISECEIWKPVLAAAQGSLSVETIDGWRNQALRWHTGPRLWALSQVNQEWPELARWIDMQATMYRELAERTGSKVIVDSSKWPLHPGLFGHIPGIEPYALQLVRDPRAVAHSWQRKKAYLGSEQQKWMKRFPAWHSGLSWSARQMVCERVKHRLGHRAMTLRYETLMTDPASALTDVASMVDEPKPDLHFLDGCSARFGVHHTVGGNPNRFERGPVELREDEKWKSAGSSVDRLMIEVLTGPLRRRYGYK